MGHTQDHQLIANYLDFVDSEAQVSFDNLSPNLFFYLPTFYHFLVSKMKMTQAHEPTEPLLQSTSIGKHLFEEIDKLSEYASPSLITTSWRWKPKYNIQNQQFMLDTHTPLSEVKERMEKLDMEVDVDLVRTKNRGTNEN